MAGDTVKPVHIAIVGGGMVGVSLALMLAQRVKHGEHGLQISLIEKFPFPEHSSDALTQPSFDSRSTALSAGSIALLKDLQVWEGLQSQAESIRDIHISDQGHYGSSLLHAEDYGVDALGCVVANSHLGQCLLAQLQHSAVTCIAPATVTGCQLTKVGAKLHLEEGVGQQAKELLADVVLIADGAGSPLRQSLGIDSHTRHYQQSAIITNIALEKPHKGVAYERFTDQGPLALLPLDNCDGAYRASVVWTRNTAEVDATMALSDEAFLAALQACFGYRAGRFLQVGTRQSYPLSLVQSAEQVRSHIVVLGNAAHFLHPVAGQGFNLSLRDCTVLVDVLAKAFRQGEPLGHFRTLEEYQTLREHDQSLTIGLTDTMVKTFSSKALSLSVLRQLGLYGLQAVPRAKQALARQMMGVL